MQCLMQNHSCKIETNKVNENQWRCCLVYILFGRAESMWNDGLNMEHHIINENPWW